MTGARAAAVRAPTSVALAVPDACGRLIGKRLTAEAWERVRASPDGFAMPDFHLVTGLRNTPLPGVSGGGAEAGFANGLLRPDERTLRRLPWDGDAVTVLCDAHRADGSPAEIAPRWVLRRQVERLDALGLTATCATELEFFLFDGDYRAAHDRGYRGLVPAYHRAGDHDLLVDGHLEHVLGAIRRQMPEAGIPVEVSHGEGGVGQFEVSLRHADPVEMADRHVVYKHGVKRIAHDNDLAATFMAKVADDAIGSGCHVHLSLTGRGGAPVLAGEDGELSPFGRAFVAGLLAHAAELCLTFAPYASSYRRLQGGTWSPARVAWGWDDRTCMVRVCGPAHLRRVEFRLPGADANPYLAVAGVIAAGLAGVEHELPLPPALEPAADPAQAIPGDVGEAAARLRGSAVARSAFGTAVVEHLVALGEHERDVARAQVTDRDLARAFEVA